MSTHRLGRVVALLLGLVLVTAACTRGDGDENGEQAEERSEERRVGKECPVLCRSRWSPYH